MDMDKSPLPGTPSPKKPPTMLFSGKPLQRRQEGLPSSFCPRRGGIPPPWLPVNQITVADSLMLHGHTFFPHLPPKRHKTSSQSITPDRRAPVSGYLTKTKGTFPVRERPLFFYQLRPAPPSRLMECMGKGRESEGRPPFCVRQQGCPRTYLSYDVGGTMGSPYSFQVSGR